MAQFKTKARAIELLGKNQIADLPTAITELWKNGYDAYGDKLCADLFKAGYKDVENDTFLISDDGFGMNRQDIEDKWIVLGTENKKRTNNNVHLEEMFGKKKRVPLGEKGIGRLSVTFLGSQMLLLSKKRNNKATALFMNWSILDNYDLFLDDIEIPILEIEDITFVKSTYKELLELFKKNLPTSDEENNKWLGHSNLKIQIEEELKLYDKIPDEISRYIVNHFQENEHGTLFVIFNPIDEIKNTSKIKNEEEQSESDYLISAMSGLFNPFDNEVLSRRENEVGIDYTDYPCFNIYNPGQTKYNYLLSKGSFFTKSEFDDCENWIDGHFDETGTFSGKIKVFGSIIPQCTFTPMSNIKKTKSGAFELKLAFWEGNARNTTMSRERYSVYENKGKLFSGLYIYRDGFRVLPYGRTDFDFLEFEKNRSKNAGRYYFSHRKMIGYIAIKKDANPMLIDKAGREGLVSNEAYRQLKLILKAFFLEIADNYYGRLSDSRKELIADVKERKRQEDLLIEEQKRENEEIKKLSRLIFENERNIDSLRKEIIFLKGQIKEHIVNGYLSSDFQQKIYLDYRKLENLIRQLKIQVSPALNLNQFDEDYDYYSDYQIKYTILEKDIEALGNNITELTYINKLKDLYVERIYEIKKNFKEKESIYLGQFEAKSKQLRQEIIDKIYKMEDVLDHYLPSKLGVDNLSEKETQEKIMQIENEYKKFCDQDIPEIQMFLSYYKNISVSKDALELIGAYRASDAKIKEENTRFFELAQVGMAIEQQDHQFNALYGQINESLRNINRMSLQESEKEEFMMLKMSFQHLEDNYKKLQPLYRVSRKVRRNILGENIKNVIIAFYGEIFEKNNIQFICSDNFCKRKIFTYESIIMPIFLNIIDNSVYWMSKKESRLIEIFISNSNEIVICNSGEKMKPSEMQKCFDVFYSRKPSGRGIGLYLAKITLRSVGMDIYTTDNKDYNKLDGACFIITNNTLEDM